MIKIICVGKIKEKFYLEALEEYKKRISRYTKLEIIEVPDVDLDNPSLQMEREKESILKYISSRDYIITLAIEGTSMSSLLFADTIEKIFIHYPNIIFIIGGSVDVHDSIKKRSHLLLSFSKLTFPHQLFRIVLLEQIYRSYKIINHESYHK